MNEIERPFVVFEVTGPDKNVKENIVIIRKNIWHIKNTSNRFLNILLIIYLSLFFFQFIDLDKKLEYYKNSKQFIKF